jgi:hypothetical protein
VQRRQVCAFIGRHPTTAELVQLDGDDSSIDLSLSRFRRQRNRDLEI